MKKKSKIQATGGDSSTPHRAHLAHARFSCVWLNIESQTQCEANRVSLK